VYLTKLKLAAVYLLGVFSNSLQVIEVSVLVLGYTSITYLLGLSYLYTTILVLFISIILGVLPLIRRNNLHLSGILGLEGLVISLAGLVIGVIV